MLAVLLLHPRPSLSACPEVSVFTRDTPVAQQDSQATTYSSPTARTGPKHPIFYYTSLYSSCCCSNLPCSTTEQYINRCRKACYTLLRYRLRSIAYSVARCFITARSIRVLPLRLSGEKVAYIATFRDNIVTR